MVLCLFEGNRPNRPFFQKIDKLFLTFFSLRETFTFFDKKRAVWAVFTNISIYSYFLFF